MFKLLATMRKDIRILLRDKVGLILMFAMPVLLVCIVTSIQNNTFQLINKNKIQIIICNRDTGKTSGVFIQAVGKIDMFKSTLVPKDASEQQITDRMHSEDVLLAVVISAHFSATLDSNATAVTGKALNAFGLDGDTLHAKSGDTSLVSLYYQPVLQESVRQSIQGALYSVLQGVQSKQILRKLYFAINEKELSEKLENDLLNNNIGITEIPVSLDKSVKKPNATQHNVPAWTIFAMFFVVISLGGSIVREKMSGAFTRLKTLPTNYFVSLLSKQLTYLLVTLLQAIVIFEIGIHLFPLIGLPALELPAAGPGLFLVTLICGWCAVSYAICIGVFARTSEQANGFGAVSIVILAAIGGLMVPGFAMPASFQAIMKFSPLHWCLEAYYGLFLEGGSMKDVLANVIPLLGITLFLQGLTLLGLKAKRLI